MNAQDFVTQSPICVAEPGSASFLAAAFPALPAINFNVLTAEQTDLINRAVLGVGDRRRLGIYYHLPINEAARLRAAMADASEGTILEAYSPLADALCCADRRYFWKKTPVGLFQVVTNRAIDSVQEANRV